MAAHDPPLDECKTNNLKFEPKAVLYIEQGKEYKHACGILACNE